MTGSPYSSEPGADHRSSESRSASDGGASTLTPAPSGRRKPALKRSLRSAQALALALGCIIGFGCFVLPGDFLAMAGPGGAAAGVVLGGVAMLVIARSYGLMVEAFPVAGGAFAYAYHTGGRYHAAICGWLLAIGYLSIVPLNATALGVLGNFVAPGLFSRGYMYSIAGFDVFAGEVLLSSAAIIAVASVQLRGVRDVGGMQLAMTVLMVAAVIIIGIATVMTQQSSPLHLQPAIAPGRSTIAAILSILAISPWLYVGFDTLPQGAEEFDFPAARGQRLMSLAIVAGAAMYSIVIIATALVFPWQELLATGTQWATGTTVQASLGRPGLTALAIAIGMAVLTGINGFSMASSRLLFSMGRAHVLPASFAALHPLHRVPHRAILFVAIVSLIAPWMGRQVILWIVDVSAFGVAAGYLYTCVAAYRFAPMHDRGKRRGRLSALAGVVISAGFLVLLTVPGAPGFMQLQSWIVLASWLLLGTALFLMSAARFRTTTAEELDRLILGGDRG